MGRRAVKQPSRSIESDPLYIGKPRRHDKRAMRAVTASGGIDQMQSGPSFYHPDFEPSSILLPQDQTERNNWCFVPDTLVTMADGTRKRIEDIVVGDVVVSHKGHPRRVLNKFSRQVNEDIVVLSVRGSSEIIRCTANHEFKAVPAEEINCVYQKSNWAMCKPGSANSQEVCDRCCTESRATLPKVNWDGKIKAGELKRRDCLYEPVYSVEKVVPELRDEGLLRLLGYYLAEGYASKYSVSIAMSREKDQEHLDEIERLLASVFPGVGFTRMDRPDRGAVEFFIYSKRFAELCKKYCGRYSHKKILSQDIVDLPPRLLLPFLGAYANGDGGQATKSNIGVLELTTVSVDLAHQLVFLLRKCGIPSSHYIDKLSNKPSYIRGRPIVSHYPAHRVKVRSKYLHILAPHSRYVVRQGLKYRRSAAHHDGSRVIRYVDKVGRERYEGIVYNIEVEEEHTYTVGSGLAVQNSRYFYKNDPIVATAIDLHAEMPLSKIKLTMPKGRDKDRNRRILEYFVRMIGPQGCNLFSKLLQLAVEYNKLGNVFIWTQFSDDGKWVQNLTLLDPDFIAAEKLEWVSGAMTAELVPNENIKTIIANGTDHPTTGTLCRRIPPDLRELIAAQQNIPLNTDPKLGSHLAHIARKQNDYDKWGVSLIERCFKNLVFKDRLRQAQDAIAARHMTPKHLIYAEGGANADIEELRQQVDAALNDPDYAIISNYQIVWELIGTAQSFINVADEWSYMNDEILMGLQMNKAFLQGESSYAGGQGVLQLMEQRYGVFRTIMEDFIYTHIFIPVCEAMGYYEIDKDDSGNEIKQYLYPEVKWNRLNLTDDTPHKQMLAQMVTEGKVDVATWLELFGLDADSVLENLEKEQFTPFDPNFSAMQQAIYTAMADRLAPALAEKRAMEMGIEIDLGGGAGSMGGGPGGAEGGFKFGSNVGITKTADGQFDLDDGTVSTRMILERVAAQMSADIMEGWKREKALVAKEAESADDPEDDIHKESETVEERRLDRRRKRIKHQQESAKDRFEVTQEATQKPPRTDMRRKKKDWGIKTRKPVAGMPELAPLLGNGTDADQMVEAADFAASLPRPLVSVARRFAESVCRRGSAVCNVFYPQLIALAATEPGSPIEDRIEQVESRYGEEIKKGSDSLRRRLDRLSRIEDPVLRKQSVRQVVEDAITDAVRTFEVAPLRGRGLKQTGKQEAENG